MAITTLERDRETGKLSLNGVDTVLRGGAYDVFFDPGRSPEFVRAGGRAHVVTRFGPGGAPCQTTADKATAATLESWDETGNDFSPFFGKMADTGCNFLRVFLTGGTLSRRQGPVTISPFTRRTVSDGVHYDVRGAVERGAWNTAFFTRLRAFVEQADRVGVVVQLSLFNYYDVVIDPRNSTTKTWSQSPWNAKNVPDRDRAWADLHLIPDATAPANRHREFTTPPTGRGTRLVQQKLIGRVMKAVAGLHNVVLEVMNEPRPVSRPADLVRLAEFSSFVVGTIVGLRASTGSDALVSVNASFVLPEGDDPPGDSDVDVWARRPGIPHYKEVDLVSYHGLTAMGSLSFNACGGVSIPRTDAAAINARADLHAAAHSDKALLFSTDAVNVIRFIHEYAGGVSMNVRDGQVRPVPGGASLEAQLVRSEVYHWARRCFARGKGRNLGRIHFQNHSTFRLPLDRIGAAARHEGIQPSVAADVAEMAEMDAGLLDAV